MAAATAAVTTAAATIATATTDATIAVTSAFTTATAFATSTSLTTAHVHRCLMLMHACAHAIGQILPVEWAVPVQVCIYSPL